MPRPGRSRRGLDHLHVGGDNLDRVGETGDVAECRLVAAELAGPAVESGEDVAESLVEFSAKLSSAWALIPAVPTTAINAWAVK